jgi:hypothetical protein
VEGVAFGGVVWWVGKRSVFLVFSFYPPNKRCIYSKSMKVVPFNSPESGDISNVSII